MTLTANDLDKIVSDAHARLDMAANIIKSAMGSEDLLASAMEESAGGVPMEDAPVETPAEAAAPAPEAAPSPEAAPTADTEAAMAEAMATPEQTPSA